MTNLYRLRRTFSGPNYAFCLTAQCLTMYPFAGSFENLYLTSFFVRLTVSALQGLLFIHPICLTTFTADLTFKNIIQVRILRSCNLWTYFAEKKSFAENPLKKNRPAVNPPKKSVNQPNIGKKFVWGSSSIVLAEAWKTAYAAGVIGAQVSELTNHVNPLSYDHVHHVAWWTWS